MFEMAPLQFDKRKKSQTDNRVTKLYTRPAYGLNSYKWYVPYTVLARHKHSLMLTFCEEEVFDDKSEPRLEQA